MNFFIKVVQFPVAWEEKKTGRTEAEGKRRSFEGRSKNTQRNGPIKSTIWKVIELLEG